MILAPALPFLTLMFIANACLRGAGDTLTPAMVFVVVDICDHGAPASKRGQLVSHEISAAELVAAATAEPALKSRPID